MKNVIAHTKESFNLTGRGIVINLEHSEDGIKKGTLLKSPKSKYEWKVKARVLFDHAIDKQKIFKNEDHEFALLSFNKDKDKTQSISKIIERENLNIFQYLITPIGHDQKPSEGEVLNIYKYD